MTRKLTGRAVSVLTAIAMIITFVVSYSAGLFTVSAASGSTLFSDNSVILDLTQGSVSITQTGYTQNGITTAYNGIYTVTANGTYTANKLSISGYNGIITVKNAILIPNGNNQTAITVSGGSDVTLLFDNVSFENQVANTYLWGLIKDYYDSFRGLKVTDSRIIAAKAFNDFASPSIDTNFLLDTKLNIQNSYAYVYGDVEKVSVIKNSRLYAYGDVNDYNSLDLINCVTSCIYTKDGLGLLDLRKVNMYLPTSRVLTVTKNYDGTNSSTAPAASYNFSATATRWEWVTHYTTVFGKKIPYTLYEPVNYPLNDNNIRQATGSASTADAGYGSIAVANRTSAYMLNNSNFSDDYVFMPPILVSQINAITPSVTLSSTSPVTYPNEITLTAALDRADAEGTVEFYNGEALLGSAAVSGGSASLAVSGLDAGSYSVTAVFLSSSGNFNDASSTAAEINVNKATPTLTLSSDKSSDYVGGTISLTASTSFNGSPLELGAISLNGAAMNYQSDGVYTLDVSEDMSGIYTLTAAVDETLNYNAASAEITIEFSDKLAAIITLEPLSDITYGDSQIFRGRVTSAITIPAVPSFNMAAAPLDDSTLDDSTPDDSTLDDSTPDDSTLDDSTPDDSTPDDSTPDDSTLDDSTPDDSTPDDSTPEPIIEPASGGGIISAVGPGAIYAPVVDGSVTLTFGSESQTVTLDENGEFALSMNNRYIFTAGEISITATYNGNYAYAVANTTDSFIVAPKSLTIEGLTAANKIYSETDLSVSLSEDYTLEGIVGSDDVSLDGTFSGSVASDYTPGTAVPVILSPVSLTGALASNYTLTAPVVTVSVSKADFDLSNLIVSPNSAREYDGTTNFTSGYTISASEGTPAKITDNLNDFVNSIVYDSENAGTRIIFVMPMSFPSSVTLFYNLTGSYSTSETEITKRQLAYEIITVDDKVYDGTTEATLHLDELYGAIEGESPTATVTGYFYNKNAGDDKPVIITGITLDGDWATNYELNIYNGIPTEYDPVTSSYTTTDYMGVPAADIPETAIDIITGNITKAVLTPSFSVTSRRYNGSTSANITMTLPGIIEGEAPTGTAAGHFETASAGTNKRVIIDSITFDADWGTNYQIGEYADPTGTITAAPVVNDDDDDDDYSSVTDDDSDDSSVSDPVEIDDSSIPLAEPDSSVIDIGIPDIPLASNPGMGMAKAASGVILMLTAAAAGIIASKSKKK